MIRTPALVLGGCGLLCIALVVVSLNGNEAGGEVVKEEAAATYVVRVQKALAKCLTESRASRLQSIASSMGMRKLAQENAALLQENKVLRPLKLHLDQLNAQREATKRKQAQLDKLREVDESSLEQEKMMFQREKAELRKRLLAVKRRERRVNLIADQQVTRRKMLLKWYDQLAAKKKQLEMVQAQPGGGGGAPAEQHVDYNRIRNTVDAAFNKWASKQQFVGMPTQVDTRGKQITMSDVDQAYANYATHNDDIQAQVKAVQGGVVLSQDTKMAKAPAANPSLAQKLHQQLHKQHQHQRQRQQAQQVQQQREQQQRQREQDEDKELDSVGMDHEDSQADAEGVVMDTFFEDDAPSDTKAYKQELDDTPSPELVAAGLRELKADAGDDAADEEHTEKKKKAAPPPADTKHQHQARAVLTDFFGEDSSTTSSPSAPKEYKEEELIVAGPGGAPRLKKVIHEVKMPSQDAPPGYHMEKNCDEHGCMTRAVPDAQEAKADDKNSMAAIDAAFNKYKRDNGVTETFVSAPPDTGNAVSPEDLKKMNAFN